MTQNEYDNLTVDTRVVAECYITESGHIHLADEEAVFPDPDYIHARVGELGTVVHVEYDKDERVPTVRFDRTGTATIVGRDEIGVISNDTNSPINEGGT